MIGDSNQVPEDILHGLTPAQQEAVSHLDGPMLVIAGPGSGKTRVITRRIARLLAAGVAPWEVLAVTFTNKAAGEMKERADQLIPEDLPGRRGLTVTTFHSFCATLLRRHAMEAGLDPSYSIFNTTDQREAMKQALVSEGLDTANYTPATMLGQVSKAKNQLLSPEDFKAQAADFISGTVARAYAGYQKVLQKNNAVDFDDLLRLSADLLQGNESVRSQSQMRYRHVLIDEYQDTNHAQFVIADAIASGHKNIFAVGDPDQSIYGWRGADVRNILEYETHYPGAKIVELGQNFRSTGHIVHAAGGLIEHNSARRDKKLSTELGDGDPVEVAGLVDEYQEARHVIDMLRRAGDDGVPWRDMAVLYRVNALSRVLEDELRRGGIPYVIARGTAFYDRKEIRDALSYLRVLANPEDGVALGRIINTPPRGIGDTTQGRLESHAARSDLSLLEACAAVDGCEDLAARARSAVGRFSDMVKEWQGFLLAGDSTQLGELVSMVLRESGMEKNDVLASEEDRQRQANLAELVSAAEEFSPPSAIESEDGTCDLSTAIREYLESVALVSDADTIDPLRGAVTLMTLHAAKGLEFELVAIVGVEDGLLPHSRANDSNAEMEEERRLLFVGMTRAARRLGISWARVRTMRGMRQATMKSRFLGEIPSENLTRTGEDAEDDGIPDYEGSGIEYDDPSAFDGDGLAEQFAPGTMVRHAQFGTGIIETFTPRRGAHSVTVRFKALGRKTLVLEYARLQRVDF